MKFLPLAFMVVFLSSDGNVYTNIYTFNAGLTGNISQYCPIQGDLRDYSSDLYSSERIEYLKVGCHYLKIKINIKNNNKRRRKKKLVI